MKLVKEIKKDNYVFTHHIGSGAFNQPENYFELIRYNKDGSKTLIPLYPPFKAKVLTRKSPIFQLDTYTEKEYQDMMNESIKKYG